MKDRTPADLAQRTGLHEKTVRRFLTGKTFHWPTVQALAKALRVDLDQVPLPPTRRSVRASPSGLERTRAANFGPVPSDPELGRVEAPVQGWKTAAHVLGISDRHLRRLRRRARTHRPPWWPSRTSLLQWFERLVTEF
jgi:transcriptional regulator with XRE-family HTH domain